MNRVEALTNTHDDRTSAVNRAAAASSSVTIAVLAPGLLAATAVASDRGPEREEPCGSLPVDAWGSDGAQGTYTIELTGVSFIPCPGDIDSDGDVDFADLLRLLASWGCGVELLPRRRDTVPISCPCSR